MDIQAISHILASQSPSRTTEISETSESVGNNFAQFLDKSLGEVNQLVNTADKKQTDLAIGKMENVHDAMIAVEKAETAMKFLMQVRNKALEAYHEVLRMQI